MQPRARGGDIRRDLVMSWPLIALLAVLLAALAWFFRRPDGPDLDPPTDAQGVDYEVLDEAEAEVQDVDAFTSPDEAEEELPDWGPGAPKS